MEERAPAIVNTIAARKSCLYERLDGEDFAYQTYALEAMPDLTLRGPAPQSYKEGEYISCLGAAQTFGRFVERPFPHLLEQALDMTVANLGLAGAGPLAFLNRPKLLEFINGGRLAVVQILSARSASNRYFRCTGFSNGFRRSDDSPVSALKAFDEIYARFPPDEINEIVSETIHSWLEDFTHLLQAIRVPKVLLFMSDRPPRLKLEQGSRQQLFGAYPQLVTQQLIDKLIPLADCYVEGVSSRGMPQTVVSPVTGKPIQVMIAGKSVEKNGYYPSPEMHHDVAEALLDPIREAIFQNI